MNAKEVLIWNYNRNRINVSLVGFSLVHMLTNNWIELEMDVYISIDPKIPFFKHLFPKVLNWNAINQPNFVHNNNHDKKRYYWQHLLFRTQKLWLWLYLRVLWTLIKEKDIITPEHIYSSFMHLILFILGSIFKMLWIK